MTGRRDDNLGGQVASKMQELVTCMCVVKFDEEGERRGMIEAIESLVLGKDFPETFERSQFKVHLVSGDIVIVPGSAISAIESMTAGSHSTRTRKKPGMKTGKATTKAMLAKKRKSSAIESSEDAAKAGPGTQSRKSNAPREQDWPLRTVCRPR